MGGDCCNLPVCGGLPDDKRSDPFRDDNNTADGGEWDGADVLRDQNQKLFAANRDLCLQVISLQTKLEESWSMIQQLEQCTWQLQSHAALSF
eukprot:3086568-Karenia_brevis.AAC.1